MDKIFQKQIREEVHSKQIGLQPLFGLIGQDIAAAKYAIECLYSYKIQVMLLDKHFGLEGTK